MYTIHIVQWDEIISEWALLFLWQISLTNSKTSPKTLILFILLSLYNSFSRKNMLKYMPWCFFLLSGGSVILQYSMTVKSFLLMIRKIGNWNQKLRMLLQNGFQPIVTPYLPIPPIVNVTLDNVNVGLAFHVLVPMGCPHVHRHKGHST